MTEQVKALPESLLPGDVVVIAWNDAAEYKNCPIWYKPGETGHPGVRRLEVGVVVTNEDGWLRVAKELTYMRPGEDKNTVNVKNTYFEMPWSWADTIYHCGSVRSVLTDVWELSCA